MMAKYPSQVKVAVSLANEVVEQGGNIRSRLGGNCPTIGEVIERAILENQDEDHTELLALRDELRRRRVP